MRRGLRGLLVSGLLALTVPSTVAASATVTPFSWDVTMPAEGGYPSECLEDGLTATLGPVHEYGSGRLVETSTGVTVQIRDGMDYAFDLSDGRHVEGVAAGNSTYVEHGSVIVITDEVREPRTIYGADGAIVGRVMIHFLSHTVYDTTDGSVTTTFERFFFTCTS
jgi:hypothetical protein